MISMLLAAMLTAGLFYMLSGQQKTYRDQLGTMTSQENLWGAMEYLQAQVRRAGYGFSGCPPAPGSGLFSSVVYKWNGSVANAYAEASPYAELVALDIDNASNTWDGTVGAGGDGVDSFSVAYAEDSTGGALVGTRLKVKAPETASAALTTYSRGVISQNDLLVLWQPGALKYCLLLQASADPTGSADTWTVPFAPISGGDINPPAAPQHTSPFPSSDGYAPNTLVMRLGTSSTRFRHYFAIDDTGAKPGLVQTRPPRLMTFQLDGSGNRINQQVIAENIEDMQIAWGCDTAVSGNPRGDGEIKEGKAAAARQSDEWAYNVAGDTVPSCVQSISRVRITLVARTTGPVQSKLGKRPAAEDRPEGSPSDDQVSTDNLGTYGRAVLTATVRPRNIRRSYK
jgi:hypothetical protein